MFLNLITEECDGNTKVKLVNTCKALAHSEHSINIIDTIIAVMILL